MTHSCPECGFEHGLELDTADAVVETEAVTEAAVEIARIEADRDVTLGRIAAKSEESEELQRIAALEGRLAGMQEILEQLAPPPAPEPEPVPVIVEPAPEPVVDDQGAAPPPIVEPLPGRTAQKSTWWG